MTLLEQVNGLRKSFKHSMLGTIDMEVEALLPNQTVTRMPYHLRLSSGFHGTTFHHGALLTLVSSTAFLHSLRVVNPHAESVQEWFNGKQPWINNMDVRFIAPAHGDVRAFSSKFTPSDGGELRIHTAIFDDQYNEVLNAITVHNTPYVHTHIA